VIEIIIGDVGEPKSVHDFFSKYLHGNYRKAELGFTVCDVELYPYTLNGDELICITEGDVKTFESARYRRLDNRCIKCEQHSRVRVGDFTNDSDAFIVERKRVDDFGSSLSGGRLYKQLNKMDKYFSGNKYLIIEGDPNKQYFRDSKPKIIKALEKAENSISELSPFEQAIRLSRLPKQQAVAWVWSIVKECAMRNIAVVPTKNLEETAHYVKMLDEGTGKIPKLRHFPKKIKELSFDETILADFKDVGVIRSKKYIKKHGSLANLIQHYMMLGLEEYEKLDIIEKRFYKTFIGDRYGNR